MHGVFNCIPSFFCMEYVLKNTHQQRKLKRFFFLLSLWPDGSWCSWTQWGFDFNTDSEESCLLLSLSHPGLPYWVRSCKRWPTEGLCPCVWVLSSFIRKNITSKGLSSALCVLILILRTTLWVRQIFIVPVRERRRVKCRGFPAQCLTHTVSGRAETWMQAFWPQTLCCCPLSTTYIALNW